MSELTDNLNDYKFTWSTPWELSEEEQRWRAGRVVASARTYPVFRYLSQSSGRRTSINPLVSMSR